MHKRFINRLAFLNLNWKDLDMSDSEKMSALDFVISVLREHEKSLDAIEEKFEKLLSDLSALAAKKGEKPEGARPSGRSSIHVSCMEWEEFRELCLEPEIVSFQIEDALKIKVLKGNMIYEYSEQIGRHLESLGCGIKVDFQASINPLKVKRFLSRELKVQENKIIHGDIQFSQ